MGRIVHDMAWVVAEASSCMHGRPVCEDPAVSMLSLGRPQLFRVVPEFRGPSDIRGPVF